MKTVRRKVVKIDKNLCTGCGECVSPCAEGAIEVINGIATVLREELCDGAGFCIGVCPTGALSIEERETVEFDEQAAEKNMSNRTYIPQKCSCGVSEDERPLLPIKIKGESKWICVKCLPGLIHG
ncbi:MAG: ATP-binding protein [Candidatus Hodarchaeales archaeon]